LKQSLELAQAEQREVDSKRAMLAEQLESLNRQLKESGEIEFDETRFKVVSGRLSQLEQIQRKVAEAEGQLKRMPVVEQTLQELTQKAESVGRRLQELDSERAAVKFDAVAFDQTRVELQQAEAAAWSAHEEQMKATHLKELLTQEAQTIEQRIADTRAVVADLKVVRDRRNRTDRLTKMFGDLRRNLVAGIRPRLAEIGSQLLDDMTSGRYNLMELDEDYNISIFDDGQAYGIDRFSGGESDLANLCLRLAVSLALAESAGLERSLIILDEVFGSQDDNRRERIYQGLAGLKPRFPQIIAITHIEELKNRVETIIEVEPTGKGWSEVRVDGAVA
jgi:exonuclease SbcC